MPSFRIFYVKGTEFIRRIGEIEIGPITTVVSPDPFLLDLTQEKIKERVGGTGKVYFADETQAEDILQSASSLGLFSQGRNLYVVRHTELWSPKEFLLLHENIERLANPVVLLFCGRKLPKALEFDDDRVTLVVFHEYRTDTIQRWSLQKMKSMGIKASPEVTERILRSLPRGLGEIINELEKLKLLLGERRAQLEDLEVLSNPQQVNIFQLIDCLLEGNRKRVVELALRFSKDPQARILLISIFQRTLLQFWALKRGEGDLFALYPTPSWKRKRLQEVVRPLSYSELSRNLLALLEWDIKFKSGYQGSSFALLLSLGLTYPLKC